VQRSPIIHASCINDLAQELQCRCCAACLTLGHVEVIYKERQLATGGSTIPVHVVVWSGGVHQCQVYQYVDKVWF
jgi:hypothetical protein